MTDEEKKKILALQCPSTRRALERPESEDLDWWLRPLPTSDSKAQCRDEDGNVFINARPISYYEAKMYDQHRVNRGAVLAQMRKESEVSSVDEAKREKAVSAFMFVKRKFKDLMKEWNLAPVWLKNEK